MAKIKEKQANYYLDSQGQFVIENYNFSKPFANFFPGIAGKYGIPMWVFYVNRGQGIVSLGTKDKDHSIIEFFPANRAWQLVSLQGFRTFIKVFTKGKAIFYEPFYNGFSNLGFRLNNQMEINSYDLKLKETNLSLGLKIKVEYFTIPNESYAGLVRIVTLQNLSPSHKRLQIVDGLPQIVPFGTTNLFLKKLGRTIEAWMNVENLERCVPFYKLSVDPTDRPEIIHIKEGNFYLGFHYNKGKAKIIKPIVDPQSIFGQVTDFSYPRNLLTAHNFQYPKNQITKNKMPSGFMILNLDMAGKQEKTLYSVIGYMRSKEALNDFVPHIIKPGYLDRKKEENKAIIEDLQSDIGTASSSLALNLYAKQTYLDNVIRGGYPVVFKTKSENSVFYLYSRKHGDLERDYNKFQIQPTYFSQGNGNYRDINQNRRSDFWFNPEIKDTNIITFFNLIQADGFNPLVVKGITFTLKNSEEFKSVLIGKIPEADLLKLLAHLNKPFTPGDVILFIEDNKIKLKVSHDELLNMLISCSQKNQEADHGEGFWTDHWSYNLDLLESYLALYPEKLKEIVFEKNVFTFYDNTEIVKPRHEKYLLYNGAPRQLHSVTPDNAKKEMIKKRTDQAHTVRAQYGSGEIYVTSLINKLFCILANKSASLDPFGIGIEMEANKPNWFDALNGLPALFGSSLCETFELKRLVLFIKKALRESGVEKFSVTEEVHEFLVNLDKLNKEYSNDSRQDRDYQYWDKSHSLKEEYRHKTRFGFSGKESQLLNLNLVDILDNILTKLDSGINKAYDNNKKVYYSYFINEVKEYEILTPPFVKPTKFVQKKLPLFLEGQVHALRLAGDKKEALTLFKGTRQSRLYDKNLKMYKVTASLKDMPEEIGRCRVFTPGWLENESIWLHMEYKYILEILRAGLFKEFYADFKNVLIPFQKPRRYGRNILENSSFLVSSAFPDKNLHGNGFVARLSGSTAEFLQIWLTMNLGRRPFFLDKQNKLNIRFAPILSGQLFTKKDCTYAFNFLSKILVVYHNPGKNDTFGINAAKPRKIFFKDKDGLPVEILSDTLPSPYADQVRSRQIKRIDINLA